MPLRKTPHQSGYPQQSVEMWTREADAISLPLVKEAHAQPRPSSVGLAYVQDEYDSLGDEQTLQWAAEGEGAARPHQTQAKGLALQAATVDGVLAERKKEVAEANADYQHATRVLGPLVRRGFDAKLRYWLCWPIIILGDTAGVWSAAVTNGDIVSIALGQALASGVAAGCSGLVGSELRDIQTARARRRDPESLSKDEQRYMHLFTGGDKGIGVVKLIGFLSVLVVALVMVGVLTLRGSIEGGASGLTFGCLAAATAIASGLLSYASADDVAELLATAEKRVRRAEKRYLRLAATEPPKLRAEAEEAARSIQAEYRLRGQAAEKRVASLSSRVLWRNAHIFGHGYPTGEQGGIIGRRFRRGDQS